MAREDPMLQLRLPSDLKDYVRETAKRNERSMNAEIVFVLRERQKTASEHRA